MRPATCTYLKFIPFRGKSGKVLIFRAINSIFSWCAPLAIADTIEVLSPANFDNVKCGSADAGADARERDRAHEYSNSVDDLEIPLHIFVSQEKRTTWHRENN